jgi:predicted nucleic acid-binding protein
MTPPLAILDANVLYSASLRHLLIWLAVTEAFDARWTEAIQDEWTRSLLRDQPSLDARRVARTRQLMDAHIPDALVTGYEPLIAELTLPDPNDRHVLAAAIHSGATIIVTKNLKDFPSSPLATHGIVAMHPDAFVRSLLGTNPDAVIDGARAHRGELVNPPRSSDEYIAALEVQGLVATAAALRLVAHLL